MENIRQSAENTWTFQLDKDLKPATKVAENCLKDNSTNILEFRPESHQERVDETEDQIDGKEVSQPQKKNLLVFCSVVGWDEIGVIWTLVGKKGETFNPKNTILTVKYDGNMKILWCFSTDGPENLVKVK